MPQKTNNIGPEEEKFNKWFEAEKKKGLEDFKLTTSRLPGDPPLDVNREEFYKELNEINNAPVKHVATYRNGKTYDKDGKEVIPMK